MTIEEKQALIEAARVGEVFLHNHPMTPKQVERNQNWVKALRSGEYRQGVNFLERRNGECCCLGVASKLLRDNHAVGDDGEYKHFGDYGLMSPQGRIFYTKFSLADLNDNHGWTFEEIANLIEASLEYGMVKS